MSEILWQPSEEAVTASNMTAFAKLAGVELVGEDNGYDTLWQWSTDHREQFWSLLWDFTGVVGDKGERTLAADSMPGAAWFPDARLNFAENLLAHRGEQAAILFRGEGGNRQVISRDELAEQVRLMRGALQQWGVKAGDCIAGFLPNCPAAVIGMLAASSLGAVWASCSPDFGVAGVLDRFSQIEPKVLLAADGYLFKIKRFDCCEKLDAIIAGLPTVENVVMLPFTDDEAVREWRRAGNAGGEGPQPARHTWAEALNVAPATELKFEQLPFDHPLYVMFSSGTTGQPKCIVHGQGGTLLQHRKEHALHCDLREGEKLFYYTTTGWMMWNWLVTALAGGSTIVLFDGNPFRPSAVALWDMVASEGIQVFGTSAKYLDACKKAGLAPANTHDLSGLRSVLSTGSPLVPESFDWIYEFVKADLMLASITGGTDIVSCFALGCPIAPVRRGELQKRGLGMAVDVWGDLEQSLVDEPGELVCTKSFPSMPTGFWNDADGSRYQEAYFDFFPGIWRHGDWVELTKNGGLIVYGRSDATLNPGGVRIGTAEIYRQVEQFASIEEAIVIGQDTGDGDQRVVLFLRLSKEQQLTEELVVQIRTEIRANATPRHVPAVILAVSDIPRTRSGKISEIAVRDVVHGRKIKNTEALANPEALDFFRDRPELKLS
ncbi:MAG: acetoacetate--CoA ligase [Planctomycetes bacterium]|nr:acetoacetate--CoA ligase [Planctomycetota bacterium]MCP4772334.1 acetoacetate--CoA ligase [Planctomycetota bacterium]MCP4861566.1 acetoacetate--CoA ligase [Planctomycetota bacterium]